MLPILDKIDQCKIDLDEEVKARNNLLQKRANSGIIEALIDLAIEQKNKNEQLSFKKQARVVLCIIEKWLRFLKGKDEYLILLSNYLSE